MYWECRQGIRASVLFVLHRLLLTFSRLLPRHSPLLSQIRAYLAAHPELAVAAVSTAAGAAGPQGAGVGGHEGVVDWAAGRGGSDEKPAVSASTGWFGRGNGGGGKAKTPKGG